MRAGPYAGFMNRRLLAGIATAAGVGALAVVLVRRRGYVRLERGLAALHLVARGGARYASNAPKLFAAAGEALEQLRQDLALETAQDVAETLGRDEGRPDEARPDGQLHRQRAARPRSAGR